MAEQVKISEDALAELKRLGAEEFELFVEAYKVFKQGFKGQEAVEEINKNIQPAIDLKKYKQVIRKFGKEYSTILSVEKTDDTVTPEEVKLKDIKDMLLKGITPEKIMGATLPQIMTAYGVAFDKTRLLENKSTENIAVAGKTDAMSGKVLDEIKHLQLETRRLADFAKKNNIKLPDESRFDNDKYVEAEYEVVDDNAKTEG